MLPELEQLLVLQDRQQKIRQIKNEIRTIPQQRKQLEAQVAASAAELENLKGQLRQLEVDRKSLELDVGTRQTTIARLRTQQYETRKNEEFQALGNEIVRYEKEIQQIEDRELEIMEKADQLKSKLPAEEKKAAGAKESAERQLADLEQKSSTLDGRLADLEREGVTIADKIDEDLLSLFERLFVSKGDAAIVALKHEVCTGCHMKVTTQTAVRAKGGKEIVSCEQCGRILYVA